MTTTLRRDRRGRFLHARAIENVKGDWMVCPHLTDDCPECRADVERSFRESLRRRWLPKRDDVRYFEP